ncbi:MAG: hypothetical protein AAF383_05695 [Cyanobacteria bacterium P01_A01_bin.83]
MVATSLVNAQETSTKRSNNNSYGVSPRELVSIARHGRFVNQGIPSHSSFRSGIRSGRITADELVASAIATNRLPEEVASDRAYLKAVTDHLKSGGCGS